MTEEKQKIVIVIGAGASCDFVMSEEKKLNENHGDIKYEIWKNAQDSVDENSDKKAQYFLSENNHKNYSFPSGEALIKMIGNPRKVFNFFGNEILDGLYEDFCKKVDWSLEGEDKNIIKLKKNFLKYFFEFLKMPPKPKEPKEKKEFSELHSYQKFLLDHEQNLNGNLKTILEITYPNYLENKFLLLGKGVECSRDFEIFLNELKFINPKDSDAVGEFKYKEKLILFLKNLFEAQNDVKAFEFFIQISTSPHLLISRLVKYYQPFSIDELLDSIKTKKIDVLKPLKINKKDLKAILKSNEEDSKKLEEQFRNELINAGKTLIALFLLRSEKRELFDNQNPENDSKIWYRHIRNLIINSGKNAKEIKEQIQHLTIISFNYDRSLDYYLRTRLSDYYNEIKERIFYPYGKLAQEEWDLNEYGSFERDGFNPYNEDELKKIRTLGQGLRVIGELDEKVLITKKFNEETRVKLKTFNKLKKDVVKFSRLISRKFYFKQVKEVLEKVYIKKLEEINKYLNENSKKEMLEYHQKDCEFLLKRVKAILSLSLKDSKIYFLGFAFHQANCNLLALNQLSKFSVEKKIYYTNFDESESINNAVKEIFYIPSDRFITIHESKKKGVYDALMHDFKLGF